ncbi:MAG: sigma-70 family RNA polymerase sigma factor [Planctomycetota bacterium]
MAEASENIDALVNAHYREVHGLLCAITRNHATADELAQEVFIVAMKRGVAPGDGMRLWLRETARRLAMNELRRKRPKSLEPDDLNALPGMSSQSSDSDSGEFDDELTALRSCMSELPEADRQLLADRYDAGTPIADIAARLGLSAEYVKLKLFRLRKTLGDRIRKRVVTRM